MNYQVLARRYRPRRFEEVVGQESVAATLRGAIHLERLAHAFLFTGPRGVGKTSMARIFAKALNCPRAADRTLDQSEWGQPCDACPTCEAIHSGQDIDVVELDGASHRGIEDIRAIIEGVNRPATRSRYKIYIIDEVHMLTREAFNALLKTLEEPPPHVKFFFATTEAHRIPETVLSRCQRFDFHPITEEAIVRRLAQILASESRTAEEGLLEKVARYGKGGLRDAQTLLDQLMTFSDGALRVEDLDRMTGRVPEDAVGRLVEGAVASDPAGVLGAVRDCFERGADPAILLEQVIDAVRARMYDLLREASSRADPGSAAGPALDRLIAFLQILIDASGKLRHSPFAEVSVEVTLLKLARLEDPAALEEVIRTLAELEKRESAAASPRGAALPSQGTTPSPGVRPAPPRARAVKPLDRAAPSQEPAPASHDRASPSHEQASPSHEQASPSHEQASPSHDRASPSHEPAPPSGGSEGPSHDPAPRSRDLAAAPHDPPASSSDRAAPSHAQAAEDAPDFRHLQSVWGQIGIELEAKHPGLAPFFKDCAPAQAAGIPGAFALEVRNEFYFRQMKSAARQEALLSLVRDVSGSDWQIRIENQGKVITVGSPGAAGGSRGGGLVSPFKLAPAPSHGVPPAPFQEGSPAPSQGAAAIHGREAAASRPAEPAAGAPGAGDGRRPGPPDASGAEGISKAPIVKKSAELFNGRLV